MRSKPNQTAPQRKAGLSVIVRDGRTGMDDPLRILSADVDQPPKPPVNSAIQPLAVTWRLVSVLLGSDQFGFVPI